MDYGLTDCSGTLPDIYTNDILTPSIGTYSGLVVILEEYPGTCWEVATELRPIDAEVISIVVDFTDCPDCLEYLSAHCGCPEGYIFDEVSKLCIISTPLCPEGFTYNPSTEECEGASSPCELDLVIAIDRSSSISATEMTSYKTFITSIIDALQDEGGENRITSDQVRVGIVYWGSASPLNGAEPGSGNNLSLQIGNASSWAVGASAGTLKNKISTMAAVGTGTSYNGQGTNYFAGLTAAYNTIVGTNARPLASKRILWITDGWPNTSNPPITINGVIQPINYADSACSGVNGTPGNNPSTAPLNVCHMPADLAGNPNTSPYTIAKRLMYTQAMDLAQDIKNGTGSTTTTPVDITAIIVGSATERSTTKGALVGSNPTGTGANDYCYFNVNTWAISEGLITPSNSRYWDASYQVTDGGGNWLRFPSNNVAGTPDYYETDFVYNPAIVDTIVSSSLACTITEPPITCEEPCVLNEETNTCDCVDVDGFVPCCYTLTNCDTGVTEYTVNTYGLPNDYLYSLDGKIVKIVGLDECLYLNIAYECDNSTPISADAVQESFDTCEECKEAVLIESCYLLTNCNNSNITLLTNQNLLAFSGKVVELNEYPGLCWTVLKTTNCPGPFATISVAQGYDDCECCFQYQCK